MEKPVRKAPPAPAASNKPVALPPHEFWPQGTTLDPVPAHGFVRRDASILIGSDVWVVIRPPQGEEIPGVESSPCAAADDFTTMQAKVVAIRNSGRDATVVFGDGEALTVSMMYVCATQQHASEIASLMIASDKAEQYHERRAFLRGAYALLNPDSGKEEVAKVLGAKGGFTLAAKVCRSLSKKQDPNKVFSGAIEPDARALHWLTFRDGDTYKGICKEFFDAVSAEGKKYANLGTILEDWIAYTDKAFSWPEEKVEEKPDPTPAPEPKKKEVKAAKKKAKDDVVVVAAVAQSKPVEITTAPSAALALKLMEQAKDGTGVIAEARARSIQAIKAKEKSEAAKKSA